MKVSAIIQAVRYKLDDVLTASEIPDKVTDGIIKSCIGDALRWCLLNANIDLLLASEEEDSDYEYIVDEICSYTEKTSPAGMKYASAPLRKSFLRMVRIRMSEWHRAIRVPIEEDSQEYLELNDGTATATADRPQAAIIRIRPCQIEAWPAGSTSNQLRLTYLVMPDLSDLDSDLSDSKDINVPSSLKTAFIYYICYLVCSAWNNNTQGTVMLNIAKMNLDGSEASNT